MSTKTKEKPSEVMVLDVYAINKVELQELVDGYKNLIVTADNLKDGKSALAIIRQKRYDIQNQQKANDKLRIEWNTKMLNSNKGKADELLAIISPIEEPIAEQVKKIEDGIQIEKDRIANEKKIATELKVKRILNTGAIAIDGGFELGNTFISNDEISFLQDEAFEIVVTGFEKVAKKISDEKAEIEKQKIEAENKAEAERKAELEKLEKEKAELLKEKAEFEAKQKEANQKAEAERLKEAEQLQKQQAEIQKQKDEIALQQKAMFDERIKMREAALFNLGMKKGKDGLFIFEGAQMLAEINQYEIENSSEEQWIGHLKSLTKDIGEIKSEEDKIREKKRLDALELKKKEEAKLRAMLPDKEKLQMFVDDLSKVTGPELETEEGSQILTEGLNIICKAMSHIQNAINTIPNAK